MTIDMILERSAGVGELDDQLPSATLFHHFHRGVENFAELGFHLQSGGRRQLIGPTTAALGPRARRRFRDRCV